jgi:SAM-dependent methyltransferase
MVQATNQDAERRGVRARVRVMDAEQLNFPDASFDRVVCGFGIMFWPDPRQGLREIHRVLRPGGRLGLSTWKDHQVQHLTQVMQAMDLEAARRSTVMDEAEPLVALLTSAGFSGVQVIPDTLRLHYPNLDTYWTVARGSGVRRLVDALDADQTARVRAALAEQLAPYQQADGYHVPATALFGTASR